MLVKAVRLFLMDSNYFQFWKPIVLDPDPKQIVSTRNAVVLNSQNRSKSDRIQIILLDSASSAAKKWKWEFSWHCPWSSFCPRLLPLYRLSIWSLNFFSSSVCIGSVPHCIVPASNDTSIVQKQLQYEATFRINFQHSFPATYNPCPSLWSKQATAMPYTTSVSDPGPESGSKSGDPWFQKKGHFFL